MVRPQIERLVTRSDRLTFLSQFTICGEFFAPVSFCLARTMYAVLKLLEVDATLNRFLSSGDIRSRVPEEFVLRTDSDSSRFSPGVKGLGGSDDFEMRRFLHRTFQSGGRDGAVRISPREHREVISAENTEPGIASSRNYATAKCSNCADEEGKNSRSIRNEPTKRSWTQSARR